MSIAQHAERILSAWTRQDHFRFETELKNAVSRSEVLAHNSQLEAERCELLQTVAEHLERFDFTLRPWTPPRCAGFVLLRHLAFSHGSDHSSKLTPKQKKVLNFGPKTAKRIAEAKLKP